MAKKVIIIGIDGGTWSLLKLFTNSGVMPNLKYLMQNGCWGYLESTIPPVTGPAWVSFATGKNPGKHGCFDFLLPRGSLRNLKPITSRDIKTITFYEYLSRFGLKTISINLPVSYPPRDRNNIFITSLMTQGDDFVFPTELKNEILELRKYRIVPNVTLRLEDKIIEYLEDIKELEKIRFKCAQKLYAKDWHCFFILFGATDWIQHLMFDKLIFQENSSETEVALEVYKQIDDFIGWFIKNMPNDSNLFILSDHGFKVYNGIFYLNEFLRREGFLKIKTSEQQDEISPHKFMEAFQKAKKKRTKIKIKIPYLIKQNLFFLRPFYKIIRKFIPLNVVSEFENCIPDLAQTICLCTTPESHAIYLNNKKRFQDGIIESHEESKIINRLIDMLKSIKDSEGVPVFKVLTKNEVYKGQTLENAPDIVLKLNKWWISTRFKNGSLFVDKPTNNHDYQGIFLAFGNNIQKNKQIQNINIVDIIPTVIHTLEIPVLKDFDGKVIAEIFVSFQEIEFKDTSLSYEKSSKQRKILEKEKSLTEDEEVKKRLKSLGYL